MSLGYLNCVGAEHVAVNRWHELDLEAILKSRGYNDEDLKKLKELGKMKLPFAEMEVEMDKIFQTVARRLMKNKWRKYERSI